jgi:segregation and condensation protein A
MEVDATFDASFEDDARTAVDATELVLDLDGYEGPIDVLLVLARQQKVDLTKISILALAEQYLGFVAAARKVRLELAADYLVMAAWLAYLKSRLLLPEPPGEDEPSGPELAAALTFQLRRLESMQDAGRRLMARPRLGVDFLPRGAPEGVTVIRRPVFELSLFDLLKAYGAQRQRRQTERLEIPVSELFTMDDLLKRLRGAMGGIVEWQKLANFLPAGLTDGLVKRSAVAAAFAASLELAREGALELRQSHLFGPIYIRRPNRHGEGGQ